MKKIVFPIIRAYSSKEYGLIIFDSDCYYHYWNHDGSYDGCSWDIKAGLDIVATEDNLNLN